MRCDVGEEAEIKAAVARTVEAFGTIDIAVNNAFELATAARTVLDTSSEDFHRQMVTGPLAALTMMKAVFPLMERSEEHTSELQSLMRISYAVFCLKNKKHKSKS